jgi:hypothetical protein
MGFLKKLKNLFDVKAAPRGADLIYLYVECGRCGERLRIGVNVRHDLSSDYEGGYTLHKEIMDSKCFLLMHAKVSFDRQYRIVDQEITGGKFITESAYHDLPQG